MKEEIEKRQEYANALVEVDESSFTNAFLRKYGEQALERADEFRKSDLRSDVSPEGRGETVVY